jgi:AcrR family transcriptional regulator
MAVNPAGRIHVPAGSGMEDQPMDDEDVTGLPASLEQAWGLRGRPHRGPKPGLSLERIVAAAVQVAAAEGLPAVSMSRVATELGTGPMSLYRYVAAKDELLALMVDAAYGSPPSESAADQGWRAGLSGFAWAMRDKLREHPWAVQIPISGLPIRPHEVAWFEHGLRCLHGTGLREDEKASVIMLISGYARNAASIDADIEAAVRASGQTPDQWMSSYARTLARLADPVRFPAISTFIAAGVFERADPPDAEFSFGLERVLDGIGALISSRSAAARQGGQDEDRRRPQIR